MDRLVTDNLMNRLKDAANRQIFGDMFQLQDQEILKSSINPRSPKHSGSLPAP